MTTYDILKAAKAAKLSVMSADEKTKNLALEYMAEELIGDTEKILEANALDISAARGTMSDVMTDRLLLTKERIRGMADGILDVEKLPDPVGRVLEKTEHKNGMVIEKTSVPMGVVSIIYESRPNVTSDAAALALKSGNACILRCGKEAHRSAQAITDALKRAIARAGLSPDILFLIEDTTRQSANELMQAVGYVDLLIPRGGASLIRACTENAKVPCIETGTGICHIYVDETADTDMALSIIENAKTSRPSVCNAEEVLIVHEKKAEEFLPKLKKLLTDKRSSEGKQPVELRLDPEASRIIDGTPAGEADFDTEFLDYILAVRITKSVDEAIEHISLHSTGHSEAIITNDTQNAEKFCRLIDSAAVYVNASTRFTDGGVFGLGCEMGISTQKLHARGPMGLCELNTYKYIIRGNGQVR